MKTSRNKKQIFILIVKYKEKEIIFGLKSNFTIENFILFEIGAK